MRRSTRPFAALAVAAAVLSVGSPALACGGLFCQNTPVDQAGERILFAADGQNVTAYVQVQYTGDAKDFSWIVPVPTPPKLSAGSDQLFTVVRQATRPQFDLKITNEGECKPEMMLDEDCRNCGMALSPGAVAEAKSVTVVSQEAVGPYDTAVIQSNDPGALKKWLKDNGYVVPPKVDPMLDPYVAGKYYFLALKLQKDKSDGDLQPIVMNYQATKPGIPIRLTGIAATANMGIWVWVLGKSRAIPENYRHAQINEAHINWLAGGGNYPGVVTAAMNEAGGQAFVTDYAGPSDVVAKSGGELGPTEGPSDPFDAKRFNLAALEKLTKPAAFARAVVDGGYFGDRNGTLDAAALVAFLKRHIPKPASVQSDDTQFYRFLEEHEADLGQTTVDTAKAMADLNEKVVKPLEDLQALFKKFPYLTSLYTTMSPEEMSQDPMFVFNPDMGDVSNIHKATGIRRCKPTLWSYEAPVDITLANGITFTATGFGGDVPNFLGGLLFPEPGFKGQPVPLASGAIPMAMPAALRIEQLKSRGDASIITDNRAMIVRTLKEAGVGSATASDPRPSNTPEAKSSPTSALAVDTNGRPVAVPLASPGAKAGSTGGKAGGVSTPSTGFGCAGCSATNGATPPATTGAGEGLTFALALMGFWGWRKRLG